MKFLYLLLLSLFLLSCSSSKPQVEKNEGASRAVESSLSNIKLERQSLLKEIQDSNNSVKFHDKQSKIDSLFDKIQIHNTKVKGIPTPLAQACLIFETKQTLATKINATPSIDFKIQKCSGYIYPGCKSKFKPYIKDDTTKLSHFWDFGDGVTSDKRYPIHTYRKLGDFNVTMKVTDAKGGFSTLTKSLNVQNRAPVSKFKIDTKEFSFNDTVKFYNRSYDIDGKIKKYYWNFGDKKSSRKKNPSHKYKAAGKYKVTLSVTDDRGKFSKSSKRVEIKHPVDVEIEIGENAFKIISILGKPQKRVKKSESTLEAFLYHNSWLLIKNGSLECIVKKDGFKRNIFGSARECSWHKENRAKYIVK